MFTCANESNSLKIWVLVLVVILNILFNIIWACIFYKWSKVSCLKKTNFKIFSFNHPTIFSPLIIAELLSDNEWTFKVFDIYKKILTTMKIDDNDLRELSNLEYEFPLSKSFLGHLKEMRRMVKDD